MGARQDRRQPARGGRMMAATPHPTLANRANFFAKSLGPAETDCIDCTDCKSGLRGSFCEITRTGGNIPTIPSIPTPASGCRRMTAATPCTLSHPGLCFQSAPEKRPNQRSTVPESDGIFMPGIRPDSGCCSQPVSAMLGLAGCAFRKAARRSDSRFLRPRQFPAPPPVHP